MEKNTLLVYFAVLGAKVWITWDKIVVETNSRQYIPGLLDIQVKKIGWVETVKSKLFL